VIRTMVISYLTEERHIKDLQASLVAACCSLGLESKSDRVPAEQPIVQPMMTNDVQLISATFENAPPT
jgi:hypothetical protein